METRSYNSRNILQFSQRQVHSAWLKTSCTLMLCNCIFSGIQRTHNLLSWAGLTSSGTGFSFIPKSPTRSMASRCSRTSASTSAKYIRYAINKGFFLLDCCSIIFLILQNWTMESFVDDALDEIRMKVGPEAHVIGAVSGGVDSTVAATLMTQ